jgi:glycosyltransferase involved in cell wall biosynthesis
MNMEKKHVIVYSFQGISDPLLKGLMLEYLVHYNSGDKSMVFHLISHEQKAMSGKEKEESENYLRSNNIYWYPVKYRGGRLLILKKLMNFLETFFIVSGIRSKYKPKLIIGFLSLAGGFSYLLAKWFRMKLVVFCFEPHSEYMIDFGIWKRSSLAFRLLHHFERRQLEHAGHVVVPNNFTLKLAEAINPRSKKYVVPISVDTDLFRYSESGRKEIRNKIGAGDKTVIIYTGKFGGIYYKIDEISGFFKKLQNADPNFFLYVITPGREEAKKSFEAAGIEQSAYFISGEVPYQELPAHLSAGDIGLLAVPGFPSQKYRTPVKTGIYLSCGLPYIINKGVAEDDLIAEKEKVGLVITDLSSVDPKQLSENINRILNDPDLKKRCSDLASSQRAIRRSVEALEKIFSEEFK